jgi:hypothetical protein
MKLKRWISYSLLLSFFVVLTPRSFWHDCDSESHSHYNSSNKKSKVHFEQKDCFACDYDLGFIDQPDFFSISFHKIHVLKFNQHLTAQYIASKFDFFLKRGPPLI